MRTAKSSTYPGSFSTSTEGGDAGRPCCRVITPPRTTLPYPDRDLDCEMAAEDAFQQLVGEIVAAGWGADEAAAAIEELARNHRLALDEVAATEAAILAVRRRS